MCPHILNMNDIKVAENVCICVIVAICFATHFLESFFFPLTVNLSKGNLRINVELV